MALLEVKNLTKSFGGLVANRDISLQVGEGEIVAIIGPNGAGKSTLFNGLAGHHAPTSGTVAFNGVQLVGTTPEAIAAMGLTRPSQIQRSFAAMRLNDHVMLGTFVFPPVPEHPRTAPRPV